MTPDGGTAAEAHDRAMHSFHTTEALVAERRADLAAEDSRRRLGAVTRLRRAASLPPRLRRSR